MCGPLRPAIEAFIAGDSPAWRYVDPREARALAAEVFSVAGRRDEPGQALLRLFFLDRWLRVFFDGSRRATANHDVARAVPGADNDIESVRTEVAP